MGFGKVLVVQKGAREHFLAARALHRLGSLAGLVVDWYAPSNGFVRRLTAFAFGSKSGPALAAIATDLPRPLVHPLRLLGLWSKWQERSAARRGCPYAGYDRTDSAFARALARMRLAPHDVFFGYSYASLEALEAEKRRGVFTVVDQIDPGPAEYRLVAEEMARHPELAGPSAPFPSAHYDRAKREWELADLIIVNSEWSREAIVAEGADPAKIEVLPLAYEAEPGQNAESRNQKAERGGQGTLPLRVLFLGQVNVRKGIGYVLEAARMLEGEPVEFVVAGPLGIRREVVAGAPKNVRWLGPVARSELSALYAQSDVFVLPTLSDGFAITQLEALAHGLPVIVTPNCGRVAEDGLTGFVIPARNSQALAESILWFVRQPGRLEEMSSRCREASRSFSVASYGDQLLGIIQEHMLRQGCVGASVVRNL